jgi:4-hydroxybenzoate polyprenyltransferase
MNIKAIVSLIRPKQWAKNAFVAAPLFFTPAALSAANVKAVAGGIASFCALASALYILNDFADRAADRKHPKKRHRPLAAGTVSLAIACLLFLVLLAAGLGLAIVLPGGVVTVVGLYAALAIAYSFGLKRIAILDVMIIAFGFVLRVEAGAVLIDVRPSAWILIITGLLALFLALAKRRDDLILELDDEHRQSLNGYSKPFLDVGVSAILGALLVAYLIYTTDPAVMDRLGTEQIFYTAPFVVMGVLRYLQIMLIEQRSGSPTAILFGDPFTIFTVLGWIGTFVWLIYV